MSAIVPSGGKCESCNTLPGHFAPLWKDVVRCAACGSWSFVGPVEESADALYDHDYFHGKEYVDYAEHKDAHALNFSRKLNALRKASPRGTIESVVDVGCAYGFFLEQCRRAEIPRIVGFDVGQDTVASCKRAGFDARQIPTGELPSEIGFKPDVVTLWDTFEHIMHPSKTLHTISRWQEGTQGLLAITTIDSSSLVARLRGTSWRQFHPPTHVHYPTRAALRMHLEGLGYDVVHHGSFGYYRAFEQYLSVLPPLKALFRGNARINHLPVYLNLHDIQFIVGRKRARS